MDHGSLVAAENKDGREDEREHLWPSIQTDLNCQLSRRRSQGGSLDSRTEDEDNTVYSVCSSDGHHLQLVTASGKFKAQIDQLDH